MIPTTSQSHPQRIQKAIRLCIFLLFLSGVFSFAATPLLIENQPLIPLENILTGLAYDPSGALLTLENDGGRLRRIALNADRSMQSITTIAQDLADPVALLRKSANSIIVAERTPGRLWQIVDGQKTLLAEGFDDISSIRFSSDGNLLICELNLGDVWKLDLSTGKKEIVLSDLDFPSDVLQVSDGLVVGELVGSSGQLGRVSKFLPARLLPGIFDRRDWELSDLAIDPVRIAADPNDSDKIFVSVRAFEAGTILTRFLQGGIYHLNHNRSLVALRFAESLYGPTDLAETADGLYAIEEKAERILFFDWQGNKKVVWDGLGQPGAFAMSSTDQDVYVAENIPDPQIARVGDSIQTVQGMPFLYRNEFIGGLARFEDGSFLLSLTSAGVMLRIDVSGADKVFSKEIFAPGKIRTSATGSIFVLDQLMNSIYEMNPQTGAIAGEFSGGAYQLSDFSLETSKSGEIRLFAADSVNNAILEYQQGKFTPWFLLSDEAPVALVRVPNLGILAATDQADSRLWWFADSGETAQIASGFPSVVDIQINPQDNSIVALSQNGWLRRLTFDLLQPAATPTPTPTFIPTPTPASTPTPTSTPTENTAISDWIVY
jgi:hypothetical protein